MYNPYIQYYENQVGGGDFDVFRGTPVQYGYGIGSFFSSLFRRIVPLVNKGIKYIAPKVAKAATSVKPHLINAAKDLASGVMKDVGEKISSTLTTKQEGAGLRRRTLKRKRCTKSQSFLKKILESKKSKKSSSKKRKQDNLFL